MKVRFVAPKCRTFNFTLLATGESPVVMMGSLGFTKCILWNLNVLYGSAAYLKYTSLNNDELMIQVNKSYISIVLRGSFY